ncbi:carboxypeptidase B-like [Arctopsyche grandis]|uniref:carboxypeptidase B-like n=1 Tax=Arctopsyche grandis TaxID=121162 RepID=UPI00406DA117
MKVLNFLFLVAIASVQACNDYLEGSKVYTVMPINMTDHLVVSSLDKIPGVDVWQHASVLGRDARILVLKYSLEVFESTLKTANVQFKVLMEDPKRTVNGRDIKVIKISSNGGNDPNKPIIVSDAGIHAREWIAPANALYMITKLVEDITESDVANNIDWFIIPLINPDGYEYSHTNARLWRKNRSTASSTTCPGVDGNRNFDFKWMESGSSSSPCSDAFAGPSPFSEIESRVLRDLINANKARVKAYLAIHSFGSNFLYPYGYDGSNPSNVAELRSLGTQVGNAIDALAAPGSPKYLVGNSAVIINYASGVSDDWAMGGSGGFDLPPSKINHVVKETWGGILVLASFIPDMLEAKAVKILGTNELIFHAFAHINLCLLCLMVDKSSFYHEANRKLSS